MNLENMTSREITALVDSGETNLESLSKEELELICDKEMAALDADELHDITLLNTCSRILSQYDSEEFAEYWSKKLDVHDLNNGLLSHNQNVPVKKKKHISAHRRISIVAAAAVLVCLLSITVVAVFDPFAAYGLSIRELLGLSGEKITGDSYDIDMANEEKDFDSFDELFAATGVTVLTPSNDIINRINRIVYSKYSDYHTVYFDVLLNNNSSVHYTVYYGDKIPEEYDEKLYVNDEKSLWHGNNIYYLEDDNSAQADLFVGEYVYIFSAESLKDIELLLDNLE